VHNLHFQRTFYCVSKQYKLLWNANRKSYMLRQTVSLPMMTFEEDFSDPLSKLLFRSILEWMKLCMSKLSRYIDF